MAAAGHFAVPDAVNHRKADFGSHTFQISRKQASGLRGGFRPMGHAHGSSGDERCAKERGGIRQVRFYRHRFGQLHGSRLHGPHAGVFVGVGAHTGTLQIGHGHANMR